MNKYTIQLTKKFQKDIRKLSVQDQELVLEKIKIVESNPRYQSKKVEGFSSRDWKEVFETRVNRNIRLFWSYDDEDERLIFMLRVGHHDILKEF